MRAFRASSAWSNPYRSVYAKGRDRKMLLRFDTARRLLWLLAQLNVQLAHACHQINNQKNWVASAGRYFVEREKVFDDVRVLLNFRYKPYAAFHS